jgi:hypothetical protein
MAWQTGTLGESRRPPSFFGLFALFASHAVCISRRTVNFHGFQMHPSCPLMATVDSGGRSTMGQLPPGGVTMVMSTLLAVGWREKTGFSMRCDLRETTDN